MLHMLTPLPHSLASSTFAKQRLPVMQCDVNVSQSEQCTATESIMSNEMKGKQFVQQISHKIRKKIILGIYLLFLTIIFISLSWLWGNLVIFFSDGM